MKQTFRITALVLLLGSACPTHTGSPRIFYTRILLADGTGRIAPGRGDVGAIEQQRQQRALQRNQKK
jgi:hypothetical protein